MPETEKKERLEKLFKRRVETAYPSREEAFERLSGPEQLTFYLGIDPTSPEVHLGHTVPLLLLRELAELGHKAILLIGDFTARIGDPTDKMAARKALSKSEVEDNMATYLTQIEKIFPKELFSVQHNSAWLAPLTFEDVIKLASNVTVQQMIQRDMFQERLKNDKPIYLHEFFYPLMQGYDSVALRTDGEVGGNDQTFNMLMGRTLEEKLIGKDKIVLTTRLLADSGSGKKMSKSEGNLIALNDSPQEIRRKVLALDDAVIPEVFQLCTEIEQRSADPREAKEELAAELVRMFHGAGAVAEAREATQIEGTGTLYRFLVDAKLATSASDAKRLIEHNAVQVNDVVVSDWNYEIKGGDEIRVGKGKLVRIK